MLVAERLVVAHPGAEMKAGAAAGPIDLTLAPGEWVALAGGNGSGKTALVLALAGLAPPRSGQVTLDGVDLADARAGGAARAAIGVVFQEPETQFVTDRVARELAFPLENLGWERGDIEARVRELLAAFDLVALADAPPERLSGGEMQRVALAAAAAPRPRIYLLDEPASYLDPAARASLLTWTRARCRDEGAAVLWTECELEACEFADRVVALAPAAGAYAVGAALRAPAPPRPPDSRPDAAPLWVGRGLRLTRRRPGGVARVLWGGLDLAIAPGERLALVGPNGSGKTALLEALAGWVEPDDGELERPAPSDVAYLLQFPEFQLFAPSALEDVRFGIERRAARGTPRAELDGRAAAALARTGLDPARHGSTAPEALSLGERRRLALAGVLVTEPIALLLDEPTAGLDAAGARSLLDALAEAGGRGAAIVIATHDARVARQLGARTVDLPPPVDRP
ncbi:MAG: ABC transporter ATP-binding protein [Candidatus Eisenbacteria bacterium]